MMRKTLIALLLTLFLLLLLTASGSGGYKYVPESVFGAKYGPSDTWAIYWYICGGDLESGYPRADGKESDRFGAATDDLSEMLSVSLPENVTVVIEVGGTKNWRAYDIDPDANSRYARPLLITRHMNL